MWLSFVETKLFGQPIVLIKLGEQGFTMLSAIRLVANLRLQFLKSAVLVIRHVIKGSNFTYFVNQRIPEIIFDETYGFIIFKFS